MAVKKYKMGEDPAGLQWASDQLGQPAEKGETYELDLTAAQEKAIVAAGWMTPPKETKEK